MPDSHTVILALWGVACFAGAYWLIERELRHTRRLLAVFTWPASPNSDETVASHIVQLLEEAKEQIEIYDDGNSFEASLYNNKTFLKAVEEKLEESPDFQVNCFFNVNEGLDFTKKFSGHSRVHIFVRRDGRRPPVHYKIIDGGVKAYLSTHKFNDHDRTYKVIDCSDVEGEEAAVVHERLFGNVRQNAGSFLPVLEA